MSASFVDHDVRLYEFTFDIKAISKDNEKAFNRYTHRPFLSKRFLDFENYLRLRFLEQRPRYFKMFETEDLRVDLKCTFQSKVHCDTQNLPKSICDAFNKVIWKDDRQIKMITVETLYGPKEQIRLTVYPYQG